MGKSKKLYKKKSFESMQNSDDTMAMFFVSMRLSNAWQQLSQGARNVYIDMKLEYYRQKKKPNNEDSTCFYFNKYIWHDIYGYKNANLMSKYIGELIQYGFIKCVLDGSTTRQKNIYQYSDMWRQYGTDAFYIEYNNMTTALAHKQEKQLP